MKRYGWLFVCFLCVVVCIYFGITARASRTDLSKDENAYLSAPFFYSESEDAITPLSDQDIITLMEASDLVVKGKVNGARTYINRCFLVPFEVQAVLKGDTQLVGDTLELYDQISLSYLDIQWWKSIYDVPTEFIDKYGAESEVIIQAQANSQFGYYGLLQENEAYILFLNKKEYTPYDDRAVRLSEYRLTDHFYARIKISALEEDGDNYNSPPQFVSLGEAGEYDILLKSDDDIRLYYSNIKRIRDYLFHQN